MSERRLLSIDLKSRDGFSEKISESGVFSDHQRQRMPVPGIESQEDEVNAADVKLYLSGLGCVNCAHKMEERIRKLPEIRMANVDFVFKKLTFRADASCDRESLVRQIRKIVKEIEPYVEVEEYSQEVKNSGAGQFRASAGKVSPAIRRKAARCALAAVLFALAILLRLPAEAEFAVFFTSYLLAGGEVVLQALRNIRQREFFDENLLMSIATIGAFAIGEYPEGVAVMLFYQAGMILQNMAVDRSRNSIAALMDIRPDFANLKTGAELRRVSPAEVKRGDIIVVKPGEKIPLDGVITEGKSLLDTSALTGESVPREVGEGDEVLGGFINQNGLLTVEVKNEFGDSAVSRILALVEDAGGRKAPTENFITKFARGYTPVVIGAAIALAVVPPVLLPGALLSEWVYKALVFLVISCPCALVISIPLSFFGGLGRASKEGILIKGSNYLEALNDVTTVVFDKTGTLTKGVFEVTQIKPRGSMGEEELLECAAYAECFSQHPIAASILKACGRAIDKSKIEAYEEVFGHGVKAKVGGKSILAGSWKLLHREGIGSVEGIRDDIGAKVINKGINSGEGIGKDIGDVEVIRINPDDPDAAGTVVHIAIEGRYAGYILIADEVKEDAAAALRDLREMGIGKLVMLTGDHRAVGEKVGAELGLDEVYCELLPDQKVEKLEMLTQENTGSGKLVFVGDGINDAPVLARADIGAAMGGLGSDAAMEAADLVLMADEPSQLVKAIRIARRTKRIVWQNIIFALGVKAVVLALGALGLAGMWEAVFADVGVALLVVLNALRVMRD